MRLKQWLRDRLRRFIAWAYGDAVAAAVAGLKDSTAADLGRLERELRGCDLAIEYRLEHQLKALQAVDVDFRDTGKIILIAQVGGRDIVKIIDTPRTMPAAEYRLLVEQLEHRYGAQPAWYDVPVGYDPAWLTDRRRGG